MYLTCINKSFSAAFPILSFHNDLTDFNNTTYTAQQTVPKSRPNLVTWVSDLYNPLAEREKLVVGWEGIIKTPVLVKRDAAPPPPPNLSMHHRS